MTIPYTDLLKFTEIMHIYIINTTPKQTLYVHMDRFKPSRAKNVGIYYYSFFFLRNITTEYLHISIGTEM